MLINFIRNLTRKQEITEISLEQLSTLWVETEQKNIESAKNVPANIWASSHLNNFYENYICPHTNVLGDNLEPIQKIMNFLDESGDCPSVAEDDPTETTDLKFLKITLAEHTINVAKEVIEIMKNGTRDYEFLLGEMLIIALAHNIGKKPAPGQNIPVDLPTKSAMLAEQFLQDLPFKKTAVKAIKTYKNSPKLNQAKILSAADHATRKMEETILEN